MPDTLTPIYNAAQTAEISYDDLVLNPTTTYSLSSEAVMDDSGRSYSHTRYTLTGEFYILGDVSASTYTAAESSRKMAELRSKLSKPGKVLKLTGIGFGDMVINGTDAGSIADVNFGPKPTVAEFRPLGNVCWAVRWSCVFSIIEPRTSNGYNLMALNYTTTHDINQAGLSTISVEGYWQIPLSAANYIGGGFAPKQLPAEADAFRDRLFIQAPDHFRPANRQFRINAEKNRVEFSFQLVEAEGEAYPPGIVHAELDESWENAELNAYSGWNGSIAGEFEVAKGYPTTIAAKLFIQLYIQRLNFIRNQANQSHRGGKFLPAVLPVRFSFGCRRFTRRYRFAAEYVVSGCLPDFIKASGIWEPLGTSHTEWKTSLRDSLSNRGVAGVRPGPEVIIEVPNLARGQNYSIRFNGSDPVDSAPVSALGFDCAGVNENNSYLAYENYVRVVKQAEAQIHKYAQAPGTSSTAIDAAAAAAAAAFAAAGNNSLSNTVAQEGAKLFEAFKTAVTAFTTARPGDLLSTDTTSTKIARSATANTSKGAKADTIEYTGTSSDYIVMHGKSMRIRFPPQVPTITQIDGVKADLMEEQVTAPQVIGMIGHCEVYAIQWAKVYYFQGGLPSTEVKPTTPGNWACLQPFG